VLGFDIGDEGRILVGIKDRFPDEDGILGICVVDHILVGICELSCPFSRVLGFRRLGCSRPCLEFVLRLAGFAGDYHEAEQENSDAQHLPKLSAAMQLQAFSERQNMHAGKGTAEKRAGVITVRLREAVRMR
jgi:hypothetical protein